MTDVANAKINSFAPVPQNEFVPQSDEPVFILTSGQLQAIITQAVEKALQDTQGVQSLKDQIRALEARQNEDIERLGRDIAYDRQRLARLEKVKPQPLQKDRGEILRALVATNGGKMLAVDARKMMHLSSSRFSELLATLKNDIEIKPYHLKRNQNVLVLK